MTLKFPRVESITQSKLLTGILTGIWRWNECGDASFASRRSGKPLLENVRAEAERLAGIVERHFLLLG